MNNSTDDEILDSFSESEMLKAIDAHVHFWTYDKKRDGWITNDMKLLKQDYLPEHLALNLKRNGVEFCVAVQVDQSELETHFLIELAKTHPVIRGVVGWVDFRAADIEDRLKYFSEYPIIKGWRHIVQGEPNDFLLGKDFQRGVRALKAFDQTYDILIYSYQLPAALEFVRQLPEQKFVLDHCAKPEIIKKDLTKWKLMMQEMATHPNVYCKLSGLFTEAAWKNWSASDFYPYLDVVFESFGPDRLMFGSDWPVMLLSGIYVQWKSLLEKYLENHEPEVYEKIFRLNAIQFYNL
ncbi:MAG: amidohydrolase family protein [Chitinophagales bacterium]